MCSRGSCHDYESSCHGSRSSCHSGPSCHYTIQRQPVQKFSYVTPCCTPVQPCYPPMQRYCPPVQRYCPPVAALLPPKVDEQTQLESPLPPSSRSEGSPGMQGVLRCSAPVSTPGRDLRPQTFPLTGERSFFNKVVV
uniref:Epidermal differentiation protein n=1 Tax=Serinus canaria TaxID=9135 RepID=A0A8C9N728_SERCA